MFDDALSVVTHDLVYKTDRPEWRRLRLAAQLRALVEQIDALLEHFEASADHLAVSPHPDTQEKSDAILRLQAAMETGSLDVTLAPQSWSRLVDNVFNVVAADDSRQGKPHRRLRRLVRDFCKAVEDGSFAPLLSASLFDALVAFGVGSGDLSLDDHLMVPSDELRSLYRVDPPKPIDLT